MDFPELTTFFLVLVRVSAMIAFLPMFIGGIVPSIVKALLALAISIIVYPASAAVTMPSTLVGFGLLITSEVLFGGLMGYGARTMMRTLRMVGEVTGRQMGMAMSRAADPLAGVRATVVGNFCDAIGILLFFATGAHLWMFYGIYESLTAWPVGKFLSGTFMRNLSLSAVSTTFVTMLQIAAPLLMVTFLISLVMALMARLVPEINVLVVGMPLRVATGLLILMFLIPIIVDAGADVCGMAVRVFTSFPQGT